ncbi:MAG: hypothetical protein A2010_11985 [Nitrospirae bacterium GWD2_57_9]|nr:MAG: hypothetical protein A2010_11985 [Nitrospirae bacterium GWD2_57_9]OGW46125.1 MAG: hypothetical protein A2078_12165 [Nitrospirae bacterium GWC2_57_9]
MNGNAGKFIDDAMMPSVMSVKKIDENCYDGTFQTHLHLTNGKQVLPLSGTKKGPGILPGP